MGYQEVGQGACPHCVVVTWAVEGAQGLQQVMAEKVARANAGCDREALGAFLPTGGAPPPPRGQLQAWAPHQ